MCFSIDIRFVLLSPVLLPVAVSLLCIHNSVRIFDIDKDTNIDIDIYTDIDTVTNIDTDTDI